MEKGADVDARNRVTITQAYCVPCLKYCNNIHQNGFTPLLAAARDGFLSIVEYLVENGADMEAKDDLVSDFVL